MQQQSPVSRLQGSQRYIWSLGECLGQGASAAVFRGRHKRSGELCAVKVFKDDGRFRMESWTKELQLLSSLQHRNVIKVEAIEKESTSKCDVLIMELCTSSVLGMLEDPKYAKGFPEQEFLTALSDVADGMSYLRTNKIIHRDIKPGNIMRVLDVDNRSIYKLADFGAARTLSDNANFMSLCGTEEYLHPDLYARAVLQQTHVRQFSASVDLWSLGATFYHIATGELPFQPFGGRNNSHIMHQMTNNKSSDTISARQSQKDGKIIYYDKLPDTCLLSSCLKRLLVPMFRGLLANKNEFMWTFDKFFEYVVTIKACININVYDTRFAMNRLLYVTPESALRHLQELIAEHTEIPASDQIIIDLNGVSLHDIVNPGASIATYPRLIKNAQYFVYSQNHVDQMQSEVVDLPEQPSFASVFEYTRDYDISLQCCTLGYFTKNVVVSTLQSQQLLCDGISALLHYIDRSMEHTREPLEKLKHEMIALHQRILMIKSSHEATGHLKHLMSHMTDDTRSHIAELDSLQKQCALILRQVDVHNERIRLYEQDRSAHKHKIDYQKASPQLYNMSCCVEKQSCGGKIDYQQDWIIKISSRFRRDKNVEVHSYNDEQIHKMERIKLRERIMKIYAVYMEHCQPTLIKLHVQSYDLIRGLCQLSCNVDSLAQKIVKGNEDLRKLSLEMDTIEKKYGMAWKKLLDCIQEAHVSNPSAGPALAQQAESSSSQEDAHGIIKDITLCSENVDKQISNIERRIELHSQLLANYVNGVAAH